MSSTREIFSKESVNRGRQPELDIAKAVLVFFLAFIHCTIECTAEENLVSGIPYLFDSIIGGPFAAPMFMFAMGVGMVYTREDSIKMLAIRGIKLELLGLVLNICRYTIPYLIGYAITSDTEKYMEPLLFRTLCNDILQFAGIAMLLIACLRWLKVSGVFMWFLGFAMSLLGTLLNGIDVNNPFGNIILGYFVGTEDAGGMVFSDFPLLNWFIVPVSGYLFGKLLIRVKDKEKFYLMLSPVALFVTIVYFISGIQTERGMFGKGQNCYYHIITSDVMISVLAAIGLLGVYYAVSKWLPEYVMNIVRIVSRNVTHVYCIHWIIIAFSINVCMYVIRGTQELAVPVTMLLSLVISVAAIWISHFISGKVRIKSKERGE